MNIYAAAVVSIQIQSHLWPMQKIYEAIHMNHVCVSIWIWNEMF